MKTAIRACTLLITFLSVPASAQYNCYIYGMHDYNAEIQSLLTYSGEPRGWVLILQSLDGYTGGMNADVVNAANAGLGVVVRLHWGYGTTGTLPPVSMYPTFASRAATYIANHINYCKFYHIGNEPNFCAEWPAGGLADGGCSPNCTDIREQITAARYIDCFEQVYNALPPALQSEAKLLVAPTGTWAGEFTCAGNGFETFDYVCYARTIYAGIPSYMIGGFALHPKTHNYSVGEITSEALSGTPAFGCAHNEYVHWYFRVYQDMMNDIPVALRDRPVFFTELNPHESGWSDTNIGYVQAAYNEINAWNAAHPNRLITAMMLYRWDDGDDRWDIHSRNQVKADLQAAVANGQTSNGCAPVSGTPTPTPTPVPCTGGWWCEEFEGAVIDQSPPEPDWNITTANSLAITQSGGALRMVGADGNWSNGGVRNSTTYSDFAVHVAVRIVNKASTPGGANESNAEIRFRTDVNAIGYSLTFHAGTDAGGNRITLRRSDSWSVYRQVSHTFTNGETLYVGIDANGSNLAIRVGSTPGGAEFADWNLTDTTFANGYVVLYDYIMKEVQFEYVRVGPSGWNPFAPEVTNWKMY